MHMHVHAGPTAVAKLLENVHAKKPAAVWKDYTAVRRTLYHAPQLQLPGRQ